MSKTYNKKEYLYINYEKCTTCKKAKKWLDENSVNYIDRQIKSENPTKDELIAWHKITGLPIKKFFNTSGLVYKSMGLSKKLEAMSDDEKFELLSTDGMLVKRPIIVSDDIVLVGFKEDEWEKIK